MDRKGQVLARSQDAQKYVGATVRGGLLARIKAGERAETHYGVTLDGRPTAGYFTRAPFTDWTVVLNIPLTEMRRPALYAAAFLSAITLALLGAAIAAATWYGRRTAEPIEALRRAAERLGRGETVVAATSGLVEIDAASRAMESASNEIARGRAELERRVAEAVASAERAHLALLQSQKLEALGRLSGGMAHDVNNVLQTLSTSHQLLRMTRDPERAGVLLSTCERAVDRAAALTAQLRAFGRAQEARLDTFDPARAVRESATLLSSALPAGIDLALEADEETWPVTADPVQLEMALLNLLINARDAIDGTGTVRVRAENIVLNAPERGLPAGDYVAITVADNGCGMSPEVLSRALDPFFTTKGVDQGSGLGLPQAYGFAQQSGGKLDVSSAEGRGTTVTIMLPRSHRELTGGESAPERLQAAGTGVLLFVEDDPLVREAVTPALTQAGLEVIVAETGDRALALIESGVRVDRLFSDVVMPGTVNGIELARRVRARYPDLPVLLATGYTDTPVDVPNVRVMSKPYRVSDAVVALTES